MTHLLSVGDGLVGVYYSILLSISGCLENVHNLKLGSLCLYYLLNTSMCQTVMLGTG